MNKFSCMDNTEFNHQEHDEADPCWVYFRVLLGRYYYVCDHVICNVLPLVSKNVSFKKCFFVRILENDGLELRVRFLADSIVVREQTAKQLANILQNAIYEFPLVPESTYTSMLSEHDKSIIHSGLPAPRLVEAIYEPEFDKYGHGDMLSLIESHFDLSSKIAQEIICAELYQERSRKWLACPLMLEVAKAISIHREAADFLKDYTDFWLYSMLNGAEYLPDFDRNIQRVESEQFDPTALSHLLPQECDLLEQWRGSLRTVLSSTKKDIGKSRNLRDNLIFNMSHLLFNRLGFSVIEEAYIARVTAYFYGRRI
ncbi:thiopeptide-type bacteriocin biosynthesis protein [Serratia fonticola]